MTNSQKKKKQVLETWTSLKPKLKPSIYLNKNKELIKDAVKFHLLQTSSFLLGVNYSRVTFDLPADWKVTPLTEPTGSQFDHTGKLNKE